MRLNVSRTTASLLSILFLAGVGCSDGAQVVNDTGDEIEEGAESVGNALQEGAEEVAEETEEVIDDADAALDCANICDQWDECVDGFDEDGCAARCTDLTTEDEGNDAIQSDLQACDDCVEAMGEDDTICNAGVFSCANVCSAFVSG